MASSVPIISCIDLAKSFGSKELFSSLSITLFEQCHVGLVGANGAGKTTLLKILAGIEPQDHGKIIAKKGLSIAYVAQHPTSSKKSIWDELHAIAEHNIDRLDKDPTTWTRIVLSKFCFPDIDLDPASSRIVETLSGGWQKRLDIAKAYAAKPDLFLFDEPTNHLDLESIQWLELFIRKEIDQYFIVSHDRSFLDAISDSILEINQQFFDGHISVPGSYSEYLRRRDEYIQAMIRRSQGLASKVRTESDWLARGPKARTTKAEARVRSAHANIAELDDLESRLKEKKLSIQFEERECETRRLATLKGVRYEESNNASTVFQGIDLVISPKMRLGIVGPNGCGKTTFLRLIAQELKPTQGTIKYAPGLKIVYFDQTRKLIPDSWTLGRALGRGKEYVDFCGNQIHIRGWAKKFLFNPDHLGMPISQLSGGERARLHIANLITEPADILLLDEPTNDLDIDTLEVLEECFLEFQGAILLVCHDRTFLSNVATQLFAINLPDSTGNYLYADIHQWQQAVKQTRALESSKDSPKASAKVQIKTEKEPLKKNKLSYREEKELESIQAHIEHEELAIAAAQKNISDLLLSSPEANVSEACRAIDAHEKKLILLWARWEELESKKGALHD